MYGEGTMGPKPIALRYCVIEPTDLGCRVYFEDGTFCDAHHHPENHHYRVVSRIGWVSGRHAGVLPRTRVRALLP
jgi:hypothetical protein